MLKWVVSGTHTLERPRNGRRYSEDILGQTKNLLLDCDQQDFVPATNIEQNHQKVNCHDLKIEDPVIKIIQDHQKEDIELKIEDGHQMQDPVLMKESRINENCPDILLNGRHTNRGKLTRQERVTNDINDTKTTSKPEPRVTSFCKENTNIKTDFTSPQVSCEIDNPRNYVIENETKSAQKQYNSSEIDHSGNGIIDTEKSTHTHSIEEGKKLTPNRIILPSENNNIKIIPPENNNTKIGSDQRYDDAEFLLFSRDRLNVNDYSATMYKTPQESQTLERPKCYHARSRSAPVLEEGLNIRNQRFIKGSDPLVSTARGKIQNRKGRLYEQINRELRLRDGAENLYKAATKKKLKDTVAKELCVVNSNLQLLREELADLNNAIHIYQNEFNTQSVPMIPLGLKESIDVDFKVLLGDIIQKHYHEKVKGYEGPCQQITSIRRACLTPVREKSGIVLLLEYYNHLYYIDKRFFPLDLISSNNFSFEWYDSLSGVPHCQRTVGFEKGSILFNVGALHTQIGARQDRSKVDGVKKAMKHFQQAAGAFQYLHDNFSHAPSMDMCPETLAMLQHLMLSQARECEVEMILLHEIRPSFQPYLDVAREAALVAESYQNTLILIAMDIVKAYVPGTWLSMVETKLNHYRAISHYYTACALCEETECIDWNLVRSVFENLYVKSKISSRNGWDDEPQPPENKEDGISLAKAHYGQALISHETALKIHRQSRQMRKIDTLQGKLKEAHDRSLEAFSSLEEEDDFSEVQSVPAVKGKSATVIEPIPPDFLRHKVEDFFKDLGPMAIFCAKHQWTSPRTVTLMKGPGQEFGFSVRGDSPVIITMVDKDSLAQRAGVSVGDFLISVSGNNVKWSPHEEVVNLIRKAGPDLVLTVVTPVGKNFLDPQKSPMDPQKSPLSERSPLSQPDSPVHHKKEKEKSGLSWTLRRRRSKSREKEKRNKDFLDNGHSGVAAR